MKFLVAIDLEGVACGIGVPFEGISRGEGKNYAFAAKQATREGCTAVDALFDNGATEVIVWDAHADGLNLDYEKFDMRCRFIQGCDMRMTKLSVFDNLDGVVFIGYHAGDNTPGAVLCHTYSMVNYAWNKIDGKQVGEFEMDAALLGKKGAKSIFLSGDQFVVEQAKKACPWCNIGTMGLFFVKLLAISIILSKVESASTVTISTPSSPMTRKPIGFIVAPPPDPPAKLPSMLFLANDFVKFLLPYSPPPAIKANVI